MEEENKPSYYMVIPSEVWSSSEITAEEKILYGHIATLANKYGYAYPTNAYLSKITGSHKNTCGNRVNKLIKSGYLMSKLIYKKDSSEVEQRHLYIKSFIPINSAIDAPINEMVDTPLNHTVEDNNTRSNNTRSNNNAENRFGEFWDLYDKKTSRAKCEPKFKKLKQADIDKIFEVLPMYVKSTPDKKYRKDPQTWLSGRCWEDEIITEENIDHSFVSTAFNNAFSNFKNVPTATMTRKRTEAFKVLVNSTELTNETVCNYFNFASTCKWAQWARDGVKYEARGIDFYLDIDSYENIKGESL